MVCAAALAGAVRQHGGALPATRLDHLRAAAHRYARRKLGTLEDFVGPVPPLAIGRGGRRLAMQVALLERWRDVLRAAA